MQPLKNDKILPFSLRLDATTICQLKCPSCPTANGSIKKSLGSQHLSYNLFQSIVENNPFIRHIELSNWGELFLNPQLLDMMKLAFEKKIMLTASNGANLNYIKPEVLEGLVKYKFEHINCSIDGVSQHVYEQYRKKGNISEVFNNIKEINRLKKELQQDRPRLSWQFIVFEHNFQEIPEAKALAKDLNMDIKFKLSWDDSLAPKPENRNWILNETKLNATTRPEFKAINKETYAQKFICSQLWRQPQLNSDGRVLGCCVNTWGDFGTYKGGSLQHVLNGEPMVYARKMLLGKVPEKEGIPCTTCSNYQSMKDEADWITLDDITPKLNKVKLQPASYVEKTQ